MRWLVVYELLAGTQGAVLSAECLEVETALKVNLSSLQVLSKRSFQGKEVAKAEMLALSKETWYLHEQLLPQCPAAVLVASGLLMLMEMELVDGIRTNLEHEERFNRISRYERSMVDAGNRLEVLTDQFWPLKSAWDSLLSMVNFIKKKIKAAREMMSPPAEGGPQITDEAHIQALEDVAAIMASEGLEWWPCRGTLIALLRHGRRSGTLAHGQVDVVDHDVDIMVGIPSADDWAQHLRWSLDARLRERGWQACFGRYSVDAGVDSAELKMAREDLMLCTRKNPDMVLDLSTYISEEGSATVFAQRYCAESHGTAGCYIPRYAGTLRSAHGRLRKSAIRPLGRCRAGHLAVPCPHQPLETLRATMADVNFTRNCLALPDVAKRQQRGYHSDESWAKGGLTSEDVEILRLRAAELDGEGYMSMTPYFRSCDFSELLRAT